MLTALNPERAQDHAPVVRNIASPESFNFQSVGKFVWVSRLGFVSYHLKPKLHQLCSTNEHHLPPKKKFHVIQSGGLSSQPVSLRGWRAGGRPPRSPSTRWNEPDVSHLPINQLTDSPTRSLCLLPRSGGGSRGGVCSRRARSTSARRALQTVCGRSRTPRWRRTKTRAPKTAAEPGRSGS